MNKAGRAEPVQQPVVYVLLPVHNRREITVAFTIELKKQTYKNYRLLLIDDGSKDGTAEAVRQIVDDVIVIRGNGNWWWAGSLQQAYAWLKRNEIRRDDVVLIMNDDTLFEADFISTGLRVLDGNPGALLTATGYNARTGAPQDSGGYVFRWEDLGCVETYDNAKINCASTRGLMSKVSDFLDVKGFRPILIPHYLSDIEFTMRARRIGKKLMIHPDFRIGIDFETTGHREIGQGSFVEYVRRVFSKRAAMNPVYWTNFILLHSPWKYKAVNLWRIWYAVYRQGVWNRTVQRLRPLKRKLLGPRKSYGGPADKDAHNR
jgi:GT2 family glycosyltransferase